MSVPTMKYMRNRNQSKPFLPKVLLEFCCDKVLHMLTKNKAVNCFTEHNRFDDNTNIKCLFRSNPSYRSDTGQLNSVWYDFVLCNIGGQDIPCQLMCF